jgi:L-ascorbate metabolism protein UlaG (beta-lactamase superfamily)
MINRRKFLRALGVGAITPTIVFSDEGPKPALKRSRWEMLFANQEMAFPTMKPVPSAWSNDTITAAWIGQATVLINFYGTRIITDPVFSERIGISILGVTTFGPKRLMAPAMSIEELGPIDLILLSHAHMDHLDLPSLQQFSRKIPIVAAKNTPDVLDGLGAETVIEMDWEEVRTVLDLEIEALQVKHFGWRFPWEVDRSRGNFNRRSFNAYRITKNGRTIVFGGDTARQEFFRDVGERHRSVDLAIMPIGAYDPWKQNHCNPEEALEMASHMNAKVIFPIHWGTFIQSDEPTNEPIERLQKAVERSSMALAVRSHGETWTLDPKSA